MIDLLLSIGGAFFLACTVHELGHVLTAWFFGVRVKDYGWSRKGPWIRRELHAEQWKDALVTLAGPLANFALAVWAQKIDPHGFLWVYSLVLGAMNLVPGIPGSDGGRFWKTLRRWNDDAGRTTGVFRG